MTQDPKPSRGRKPMKSDREIYRSITARAAEHNVRVALNREASRFAECDGCGAMAEVFFEDKDGNLICEGCYGITD